MKPVPEYTARTASCAMKLFWVFRSQHTVVVAVLEC